MCTGCRGMMYYFLQKAKDRGKLDQLKEFTFLVGEQETLTNSNKRKTVLVGVCTERYRGLGRYVPGCPPLSNEVIRKIPEVFGK
jgi:hypothetical protein